MVREMPGSVTSLFSEADDFETALRAEGCVRLLVTGRGAFRARLTQITLDRLRLASAEEEVARVAFVAAPASTVVVWWPVGGSPAPFWGGMEMRAGDMLNLGPGQRVHTRVEGPCRWGGIRLPDEELLHYGRSLCGAGFAVPPVLAVRRPAPAAARHLAQLHRAATRMAEARSGALADVEAAHGLEQQLIPALIECLSDGPAQEETSAARRHRGILAGFEDLLQAEPFPNMSEICGALGVSERLLRGCCKEHLGMGPSRYLRLRRMQQVHRALRNENPDTGSVSEVAERYGIRDLGRFAGDYRALYGEFPSATLRRNSQGVAELSLGRPRVKLL
jgi:AraC-like DNA-binding protein